MKPTFRSGIGRVLSAWVLGCLAVLLTSCSTTVQLKSEPPGATAFANGNPVGKTPMEYSPPGPQTIEFRLDGYFPETVSYLPNTGQNALTATLAPTTLTKKYSVTSVPPGARLTLEGKPAGTTPVEGLSVTFSRGDKSAPWEPQTLVAAKPDYQVESLKLNAATDAVPTFELGLIHATREYAVSAKNEDGADLQAEVSLGDKVIGQTPFTVPIVYDRPSKAVPWPTFDLSVGIQGKYLPTPAKLSFERERSIPLVLTALTEITTTWSYPAVTMSPVGVEFKMQSKEILAILSTKEPTEIVGELKQVTNYGRKDLKDVAVTRAESINSFCVTPDGDHIIFSLTSRDPHGNLYSNLYIKQAADASSGAAQLTQGERYLDTTPFMAIDQTQNLVFTSNRYDRNKPDACLVTLVENRISGGISRLTNDSRFNYSPTYSTSTRPVFYLSIEPNFPKAEAQISSIRFDGNLPSQISTTAIEVNNNYRDRIFFTRLDPDTNKKQIFSITPDGKLETGVISQEDFHAANCFNPFPSQDGKRVLFVSDRGVDEKGRHNNDIYVMNSDGSNLQQLTQNGSDDILPEWSPTDDSVVFFLSNRGGAYNIWRLTLLKGHK